MDIIHKIFFKKSTLKLSIRIYIDLGIDNNDFLIILNR